MRNRNDEKGFMPRPDAQLCVGSPKFADPSLQSAIADRGLPATWALALANGPRQALAGVEGDFAVALREASGRTLLAVDRFSIRTLCYRLDRDLLRFAERADALADPGHEIDPQAIFDYLYFHTIPSPRTIFKGIHRLPAGNYALFDNG